MMPLLRIGNCKLEIGKVKSNILLRPGMIAKLTGHGGWRTIQMIIE
jgi:hypothetical protein